jgi:hypothetical protein
MTIEVFGHGAFEWVAIFHNANLYRCACGNHSNEYFLVCRRFGPSWARWVCAIDSGKVSVTNDRKGRTVLKLLAETEFETLNICALAHEKLLASQVNQRFYVGHGFATVA